VIHLGRDGEWELANSEGVAEEKQGTYESQENIIDISRRK